MKDYSCEDGALETTIIGKQKKKKSDIMRKLPGPQLIEGQGKPLYRNIRFKGNCVETYR